MSQITKQHHCTIPSVDCQPPPTPSSKTFQGRVEIWPEHRYFTAINVCLHQLTSPRQCVSLVWQLWCSKITFMHLKLRSGYMSILAQLKNHLHALSDHFISFYSVAILKIIWVLRTNTDIYCVRRKSPSDLTHTLRWIAYQQPWGRWTAYQKSSFRVFSRPEAFWNIPVPPFSLRMHFGQVMPAQSSVTLFYSAQDTAGKVTRPRQALGPISHIMNLEAQLLDDLEPTPQKKEKEKQKYTNSPDFAL